MESIRVVLCQFLIPVKNGQRITVSASHKPQEEEGKRAAVILETQGNSTKTSSLPVDQVSIRCGKGYQGCFSERVTEPFMKFADLKRRIEFRGTDIFYPGNYYTAASRIVDFRVEPLPNAINSYRFSWTEPKIMSEYGEVRADSYDIQYTEDFNQIFSTVTDMNRLVGVPTPLVPD
ncbi:unnamed protein product [Orchesella dallaii]|uniref:Uncharacterized protein n=1 Tax=Orchesella dallaii TaxID=48710 RepID=A0ABP1RK93_9HEXA